MFSTSSAHDNCQFQPWLVLRRQTVLNLMALVTRTMLPGGNGTKHIAWWSASMALCKAPKHHHKTLVLYLPNGCHDHCCWQKKKPQCTIIILASNYYTFLLANLSNFGTRNGDLGCWITFPLKWNVTSESEVACGAGQEEKIMSLFQCLKNEVDHHGQSKGVRCNL